MKDRSAMSSKIKRISMVMKEKHLECLYIFIYLESLFEKIFHNNLILIERKSSSIAISKWKLC